MEMNSLVDSTKKCIHRAAARLVALVLRLGAVWDPANFRLWEKCGYHITPTHFYYPIPDTRELEKLDLRPSKLPGIDLRPDFQSRLMKEVFSHFSQEFNSFPTKPIGPGSFHLDNDAFTGIDPHVYYCMVRHFRPKTVIEVGSGHSTLLGAQAIRMNDATRYVCIDPWPRDFISAGLPRIELVRQKVETLGFEFFQQLRANDILFVDSSHVVRTSGDVCFMILEVLPRLAKGVLVHFHDIFLPFDYPKEYIVGRQRFWTEQYLLQAYLAENKHVEVLFASNFASKEHAAEVREVFPKALRIGGESFWIRKC